MSEEEKKAYNYLKNSTDGFLNSWNVAIKSDNFKKYDYMQLRILLNLIEKQQKFKEDVVNSIMLWDEEDLPENDVVIETLKTIIHEFSRLENIEDEKIQVAVEFVEEKRDKHWEKKIKEKIKELEDYMILFTNDKEKFNRYKYARNILEKLLKENNNENI